MATTTNFGWETPDDTDLVKDGAAAMRTLGNAIDTSFVDLKGGTTGQILSKASNSDLDYAWITNDVGDITAVTAGTGITGGGSSGAVTITNDMATKIDAKGDLIVGTGADTYDRLAVGTNGHVLTADSTASTGTKWAAVATTKNFSLLNAGGTALTGAATITVSGISGMDQLYVVLANASSANASSYISLRFNADSGANYNFYGAQFELNDAWDVGPMGGQSFANSTEIYIGRMPGATAGVVQGGLMLNGCNSSGNKMFQVAGSGSSASTYGQRFYSTLGWYTGASTISSVSAISSTGNFDGGTIYVYGSA